MEDTLAMGIREIRADLGGRVDAAYYLKEPTVITKTGRPRAAIVPFDWLEELYAFRAAVAGR